MQTITLLNEKGGVGKTTVATHLAAGLAIRGAKVMLIDADPQGSAGKSLGFAKPPAGLYPLLVQAAEWSEVIIRPKHEQWAGDYTAKGELYLCPSNIETRGIPLMLNDVTELAVRLEELEHYMDYVIIDTSPTPSLLHAMIALASDGMIHPTQAEALSLEGLAESMRHLQGVRKTRQSYNLPPTETLGVIPVMVEANTLAHKSGLAKISKAFPADKIWTPLGNRTVYKQASDNRKMLYAYDPGHIATTELWNIVDKIKKAS